MKSHIKTVLFLILCVGLGVAIGKAYLWLREPKQPPNNMTKKDEHPPTITGMGPPPAHRGFTIPAADLPTLATLLQKNDELHATTVGIEYGPTLTRDALTAAVSAAHLKNNKVVLLPPPTFSKENPYPHPLEDIAADAEAAHVDYLTISWLADNPDPGYWRVQQGNVLARYSGKIILAGTVDVVLRIPQWRADVIGVIGPLPLAKRLPDAPADVSVDDLRIAWSCTLTSLESLASANGGKKLALLHMNVPVEVSAQFPKPGTPDTPAANPALQDTLYQALLLETLNRYQVTDLLLFNWGHPDDTSAPNNITGMLKRIGDSWDDSKKTTPATSK